VENFRNSSSVANQILHHEIKVDQIFPYPHLQNQEGPTMHTQSPVVIGPREAFSCTPKSVSVGSAYLLTQTRKPTDHRLSFATATTVINICLEKLLSRLSVGRPKAFFEQPPILRAEIEATSCKGLTLVAVVLVFSAWLLSELLRSIVQSSATGSLSFELISSSRRCA
jgi:hypothetical protein